MSLVQMPAPRPVLAVVGDAGDLLQVGERRGDQDGTEDLLADDLHVGAGVGEHGGLDEVAAVAEPAAAGQRGGAVGLARLQVAGHPAELLVGDQRAHLRPRLHPRSHLDRLGDLGDAVHDLVEPEMADALAAWRLAAADPARVTTYGEASMVTTP